MLAAAALGFILLFSFSSYVDAGTTATAFNGMYVQDGLALFFNSPKTDRDGQCVAFYQPGPPVVNYGGDAAPTHSYLRDYYYRGWVCAPAGQTLTKDQAADLIKSFKVTAK